MNQEPQPALKGRLRRVGLGALAVAVVAVVFGILNRSRSEGRLKEWTREQSIPSVAVVVVPERGVGAQELVLPGEIEAFYQAPIHARVSGFLKMWYQDIGAHVKAGQLLAEIDTPELDQQLLQAKADLASAQAKRQARAVDRVLDGNRTWSPRPFSQQTIDDKVADAEAREAQANAAEANVRGAWL